MKPMRKIEQKRVANWLGTPSRVVKQLIVSIWSYLTYPISNFRQNATKLFFCNLYKGKADPLIFDGKNYRYFEQIDMVYDIKNLTQKSVLDLGCGNGSLLLWLTTKQISLKEYIGIDFAHIDSKLSNNAKIIQKDIADIQINETNANIIFAVNVLCYINDATLSSIFESTKERTELIIIEPIPSIFWDAHFDGIKLYYRNSHKLISLLASKGWHVKCTAIDFGFKFFDNYLFPLSYCLLLVSDSR